MTNEDFKKVCEIVSEGFTIDEACKRIGIKRSAFYYRTNKKQRAELKSIKMANYKYGCGKAYNMLYPMEEDELS